MGNRELAAPDELNMVRIFLLETCNRADDWMVALVFRVSAVSGLPWESSAGVAIWCGFNRKSNNVITS